MKIDGLRQTPAWRGLRRAILERIADLQGLLEAPNDAEATATLRGQIKELRALIERVEPEISDSIPDSTKGLSLY